MHGTLLHVYKDFDPLTREQRLHRCAADFALALGRPGPDLTVERGEYGKPYFVNAPWLQFSVSHSGAYWLLGLGLEELGVDIQQKRRCDHLALAKRWFGPEEYEYVRQSGPDGFYAIWSAHEAYLKFFGCGFARPDIDANVVAGGRLADRCGEARLIFPPLLDGYAVCVACSGGPLDIIRHDS